MRVLARIAFLGLALLVVAGLAVPDLASAHVRRPESSVEVVDPAPVPLPPASIASASPAPLPLWPLAAGLAVAGLTLTLASPRRALRLALVLLLVVAAVEMGVHSVHHLADRQAASHCTVALASAHVHGASMDVRCGDLRTPAPVGAVVVAETVRPGATPLRPDEGRAPPA